jgi:arginine decarboxylase
MAEVNKIPSALVTGTRIPYQYFLSKGYGQADAGGGSNPWEASSYDAALTMAGIQNFNMIQYTSILPPEAKMLSRARALEKVHFGSVMEGIYSKMNGVKGERITAALLVTRIETMKGDKVGSFCTEYMGDASEAKVKKILLRDAQNMIARRGYGAAKLAWKKKVKGTQYYFTPEHFVFQSLKIKKKYGTVIAGLFFINYIFPLTHTI